MTEVRFSGEVDGWDSEGASMRAFPSVGDVDVIAELEKHWPAITDYRNAARPRLRVWLGIEPDPTKLHIEGAAGEARAESGWTGTDVTPGDPPVLRVGDLDLLEELRELDGREVVLVVEEE